MSFMSRERCDKPPPGKVHQVCAKNKLGFNFIFTLCGFFYSLSLLAATVRVENIISSSSSSSFAFMLKVLWASFTALLHESNSALSAAVTCMQHFYNVKWILFSRERDLRCIALVGNGMTEIPFAIHLFISLHDGETVAHFNLMQNSNLNRHKDLIIGPK